MKTNRAGRAKQFLPFAALRGFEETVAAKRHIAQPRRELSDTQAAELSELLGKIKKGDRLSVIHYAADCYVTTAGEITEYDTVFRFMRLGTVKIKFEDIAEIILNDKSG